MKRKLDCIEDIYPLTIVQMRYGGKYIIFNVESDIEMVHEATFAEFSIEKWLEDNLYPCNYGIGVNINKAFEDYKVRYNKNPFNK